MKKLLLSLLITLSVCTAYGQKLSGAGWTLNTNAVFNGATNAFMGRLTMEQGSITWSNSQAQLTAIVATMPNGAGFLWMSNGTAAWVILKDPAGAISTNPVTGGGGGGSFSGDVNQFGTSGGQTHIITGAQLTNLFTWLASVVTNTGGSITESNSSISFRDGSGTLGDFIFFDTGQAKLGLGKVLISPQGIFTLAAGGGMNGGNLGATNFSLLQAAGSVSGGTNGVAPSGITLNADGALRVTGTGSFSNAVVVQGNGVFNQNVTVASAVQAGSFQTVGGTGTNIIGYTLLTNWGFAVSNANGAVGTWLGTNGNADIGKNLTATNGTDFIGELQGTVTGGNATAGYYGEIVTNKVASGSAVSLTTATGANITSISLTAGDWNVSGNVNFSASTATVTGTSAGISATSATVPTDGSEVFSGVQVTLLSENDSVTLPPKQINVTTTTTVFLVGKCTFSAGSVSAFGSILARRIR